MMDGCSIRPHQLSLWASPGETSIRRRQRGGVFTLSFPSQLPSGDMVVAGHRSLGQHSRQATSLKPRTQDHGKHSFTAAVARNRSSSHPQGRRSVRPNTATSVIPLKRYSPLVQSTDAPAYGGRPYSADTCEQNVNTQSIPLFNFHPNGWFVRRLLLVK